jgi:spore coat protein U-like protein
MRHCIDTWPLDCYPWSTSCNFTLLPLSSSSQTAGSADGDGATLTANFPASSRSPIKISIYGRIPAEQNAWVDMYHGSVTVTVSY